MGGSPMSSTNVLRSLALSDSWWTTIDDGGMQFIALIKNDNVSPVVP